MDQIIGFFRYFMCEDGEFEALVHLYWDRYQGRFEVVIPKQRVSKARIDVDLTERALPEEDYLHYADIHSHNSMKADFSDIDDRDEQATRLYLVVGELDRLYPSISARVSCGGTFLPVDPSLVVEKNPGGFPDEWLEHVTPVRPKRRHFRMWRKFPEAMAS